MPLPPPNSVRAKRREVARHYERARRKRGTTTDLISRKRLRDLGRFFHHRYGQLVLPDDDSGRADLAVALDHIVWRPDAGSVLRKWVRSWAPWITDSELETMRDAAGRTWTATDLGTHLGLTDDERTNLKITTIAPCGLTEAEWTEKRKSRKRNRDRDTKRRKRAEAKTRKMPNSREIRRDNVRALLSSKWISTDRLTDLITIFPGLCTLSRASRRRAVNRIVNDLADAKSIEIKRGPHGARLIREIHDSND
jgi:hypothetical protein